MPRAKFRSSKPGGRKGQKNYKHGKNKQFPRNGKRKANEIDPVARKYRFIRINKENEDALRRQQQAEEKFQQQDQAVDLESSSEEENPMDQLMSTLKAAGQNVQNNKKKAIDSSDESEEDDEIGDDDDDDVDDDESVSADGGKDDPDEIDSDSEKGFQQTAFDLKDIEDGDSDYDEDGDDTFPEKFEEQSKPRGRKYHSSEEENEGEEDENESESDDDLPEETLLRPEESKDRKSFEDSFEVDDNDDEEKEEEEEEEENEIADSDDEAAKSGPQSETDIFSLHLGYDLSAELLDCVNTTHYSKKEILNWPTVGRLQVEIPTVKGNDKDGAEAPKKRKKTLLDDDTEYALEGTVPTLYDSSNINLNALNVKVQLQSNIAAANKSNLNETGAIFTKLQTELFSIMNNYQDLYYPQRTHANGEEIRFIYCLHTLDHILKTRAKILNHNAKLSKMAPGSSKAPAIIPDNYRDQGLFRTKVLIVAPFRDSALKIVKILIALLFPQNTGGNQVMHYKRFLEEFGGENLQFPKKNPKPEDYEQTFAGNSDDTFRIGITITRKAMKLYSDFYSSDILIVSPLGLRMIIGAPGDKERDYDFLASIELLILDQAEIFLAQNWDHLLHIMDHLHLQPQSARNTDFSRVRAWCLNGWTRFYRQTLLFTSHELPEFRSLFNSRCSNYRGKVRLLNPIIGGSIKHVAVQIPQVFHHIEVSSIQSSFDQRFDHFIKTILPQFKSASMAHCLIFVPSYFDFVRIRNYFRKETINFVHISEYTKEGRIEKGRSLFFHGGAHFMLYTERAHFFRRARVKGIRHLIMYQPPTFPHFYPELINLMQEVNQNPRTGGESSMTVTVLYTKYDMLQIASIVGSERAEKMASSEKTTHMFMTED